MSYEDNIPTREVLDLPVAGKGLLILAALVVAVLLAVRYGVR